MKNSKFTSFWSIGLGTNLLLIVSLYYSNILVGIENFSNGISLPLYIIIPGILLLLGIWALTRAKKIFDLPRISLIFLVISFAFSLAAEQTWNLYEHVLDIDPYPSIADFFYLGAPIFMFISLLLFLKPLRNQISKKSIIFAVAISLVLLIPSVIATYNVGVEDEPFEIFVALLYPIVDSLLLIPAIIAILFSVLNQKNFFWIMILAGIIVLISADTIFLFLVIDDAYVDGHPVDILWITSYTIWAFTMYYIINKSKYASKEIETEEKYKMRGIERFGIVITLILINVSIGIILIGLNYLTNLNTEGNAIAYFSWFLIMIVVIFSSIILFLNSKLNKNLNLRTIKIEKLSDELIKAERFSAIGELASKLAHDLRNPLGVIISSNALNVLNPTKEVVSKNNVRIQRSIERMQHQIDNVMDFVRVRKLNLSKISLHTLIEDSINSLSIPNGITIKKPIENPNIVCDAEQFLIVFNNIIFNAIQKLENYGSITIIYNQDDSNNIIKILDSGESIPDEIMSKIFEPLFTTKYQGTGLGLASCKQIIDQHMGTIKVENNPTTFIVTIPKDMK